MRKMPLRAQPISSIRAPVNRCVTFRAAEKLEYFVKQSDPNARSPRKSTGRHADARNAYVSYIAHSCGGADSRDRVWRRAGRLRTFEARLWRDGLGFRFGGHRQSSSARSSRGRSIVAEVRQQFFVRCDRLHAFPAPHRSEEHTSELQSRPHLVCRLLLEKKKKKKKIITVHHRILE